MPPPPNKPCLQKAWKIRASSELKAKGSPASLRSQGLPPPDPPKQPYHQDLLPPRYGEEVPGEDTDRAFLRFGFVPEWGRSLNHLTGEREPGMAVFEVADEEEFVVPEEDPLPALKGIVLELWQDKLPLIARNARLVEERDGSAWLSRSDLWILPFDLSIHFPDWLPDAAHELAKKWNRDRTKWLPLRDRFGRYRDLGVRLLEGFGLPQEHSEAEV